MDMGVLEYAPSVKRGTSYCVRCPSGSSLLSPESIGLVVSLVGRGIGLVDGLD